MSCESCSQFDRYICYICYILLRRKGELVEHATDLDARARKLGAAAEGSKTMLGVLRAKVSRMEAAGADSTEKLAETAKELEEVVAKLGSFKGQRRENKKHAQLVEQVENLKRLFPGVHGRLIELVGPTQRRYNIAATRTLGKFIDAVVVDKQEDAFKCMQFLKEAHTMRCSFIPLDAVSVEPAPARLRALGERRAEYRLAIDCLKYDSRFEKAAQYACGDTVVADDLTAARKLCFTNEIEQNGVKVRAITLKGDVIHRNGNMTGGSASRLASEEEDAFAQGAIERLRHRRAALQESVGELEKAGGRGGSKGRARSRRGGGSVYEVELESTRAEIGTCESRLAAIESDLAVTTAKLDGVRKQLATVESELRKLRPSLQRMQSDISTCVAALRSTRQSSSAVGYALPALTPPSPPHTRARVPSARKRRSQKPSPQRARYARKSLRRGAATSASPMLPSSKRCAGSVPRRMSKRAAAWRSARRSLRRRRCAVIYACLRFVHLLPLPSWCPPTWCARSLRC